jgi:tetratricopeptide (TPR) repeat protein
MRGRCCLPVFRVLAQTFLSLCLLLSLCTFAVAQIPTQSGDIVGQVRVSKGSFPPNYLLVTLEMRGAPAGTVYTDAEGKFYFQDLVANVYHIIITEKGFRPVDVSVNLNPSIQRTMYVNIELIPEETEPRPNAARGSPRGGNPAIVDQSAMLGKYPKDARKHYEKAQQLQEEGKQHAAIGEYRKALAAAPDMYFARNNLGSLYVEEQSFTEAEAEFRKVIEQNRADANGYFNMANVCLLTKRLDEAVDFIQQGMSREPQSAFGHFLMGSVMLQKGDQPGAEKQLQAALYQDPGMANAHLALVNLYMQQKRNPEAVQELQAFLRQSPDSSFASHARELLKKLQAEPTPQ